MVRYPVSVHSLCQSSSRRTRPTCRSTQTVKALFSLLRVLHGAQLDQAKEIFGGSVPCLPRSVPSTRRSFRSRPPVPPAPRGRDRKSTRLNSSHVAISYAVFCLKKKKKKRNMVHRETNIEKKKKKK